MKAARLHAYHEALKLDEVDEPKARRPARRRRADRRGRAVPHRPAHPGGPVGGEVRGRLPYTPGHENAGWIHEVGSGVTNVEVGDTVIVHPFITCGLCRPCRRGDDMHCVNGSFPGINRDGGFAEFLLTSARSVVKLDPSLHPPQIAALADAGLTAIHAVKKAIPVLGAGTRAVVIGAGGLGHIGIQCLRAYTPTEIIVVDPSEPALALARELGAAPHGPGRRQPARHGPGAHRRHGRRGDHRLRRREGRDRGRDRDGPGRRLLLRDRLRREHRHPDDRRHLARDLVHRQPRRDLRRPAGPDDADRAGPGHPAHEHLSAGRDQRRHGGPRRRPAPGPRHPRPGARRASTPWASDCTSTTRRGGCCRPASTSWPTRSRSRSVRRAATWCSSGSRARR